MARSGESERVKVVATNRRARRNYTIVETFEAGLVLMGSEVKSLRESKLEFKDSYADIRGGEAFLVGAFIGPYKFARDGGHESERERKLLLHRSEIDRVAGQVAEKGLTLIPLSVYFTRGLAKVEMALAKGRRQFDKRQKLRERDQRREIERARLER